MLVVAMTQAKARRWAAACAAVLMRGAPCPTALTDSRRSRLRVRPSAALRERRCMIATPRRPRARRSACQPLHGVRRVGELTAANGADRLDELLDE